MVLKFSSTAELQSLIDFVNNGVTVTRLSKQDGEYFLTLHKLAVGTTETENTVVKLKLIQEER